MSIFLGIIGAIVLLIAWIPETIQIITEKQSKLNPQFEIFYFIGTLLLLTYALLIKDIVFSFVNFFILLQVLISIYFSFKKKKRKN